MVKNGVLKIFQWNEPYFKKVTTHTNNSTYLSKIICQKSFTINCGWKRGILLFLGIDWNHSTTIKHVMDIWGLTYKYLLVIDAMSSL